ncbi:uncharacterized protein LOC110834390 [Zootermopsis nevadensis]|uniref:uncharacterized protein LOC110834390 n=1 Tax=Zootermopsis nevadensis TaxID=136037 RepID=UPI000B8E2D4E|nr:uncharacterized protein LOC110834390 [Zootermopsis nevadensis]
MSVVCVERRGEKVGRRVASVFEMKNQLVVKCGAFRMLEWPCRQIPVEWDLDLDLNLELTPTVVEHPRSKLQRYLSEGHHNHHDMVQTSSAAVPKRSATMTFHRSVSHPNQPHLFAEQQGQHNRMVVDSSAKLPQESGNMTVDRSLSNQPAVKLRRFLSEGHQNKQESSPSASRQRSATVTFNRRQQMDGQQLYCQTHGCSQPADPDTGQHKEKLKSATQDLFELLERVQSSRLDDQRCVLPPYFTQVGYPPITVCPPEDVFSLPSTGRSATQDLFELLERVQSSRLDDQRCVLPPYFTQVGYPPITVCPPEDVFSLPSTGRVCAAVLNETT